MPEIKFEITKHIGVLGDAGAGYKKELNAGYKKELNMVSWNDRAPKYDIRDWDENHERMRKGITLSEEEMKNLVELMNNNN